MTLELLPPELRKRVQKILTQRIDGLVSEYEFEGNLVATAYQYWLAATQRQADELLDQFDGFDELLCAVAVALQAELPMLISICDQVAPSQRSRLLPLLTRRLEESLARGGLDGWSIDAADRLLSMTGTLPEEVVTRLDSPAPLSGQAKLAARMYVMSGDDARAIEIAAADTANGCTALLSMVAAKSTSRSWTQLATPLLRAQLARRGWWGDIVAVSTALMVAELPKPALEWSAAVVDRRLAIEPAKRAPSFAFMSKHHWATENACGERDIRILGPLAAVDYLCGEPERASRRARAPIADVDPAGWNTAAHDALAKWVLTRLEKNADRAIEALLAIDPGHTYLGLIRAQIEFDLSEYLATDDPLQAAHHRGAAHRALLAPGVKLHLGRFEHERLLAGLPAAAARVNPE